MGRYCAVCGVWEHIWLCYVWCVVYVVGGNGFVPSVCLSFFLVFLSFFLSFLSFLSSQYPAMGYGLGVVCSCVIAITDDILYEIPTWNICTVVIAVILV